MLVRSGLLPEVHCAEVHVEDGEDVVLARGASANLGKRSAEQRFRNAVSGSQYAMPMYQKKAMIVRMEKEGCFNKAQTIMGHEKKVKEEKCSVGIQQNKQIIHGSLTRRWSSAKRKIVPLFSLAVEEQLGRISAICKMVELRVSLRRRSTWLWFSRRRRIISSAVRLSRLLRLRMLRPLIL